MRQAIGRSLAAALLSGVTLALPAQSADRGPDGNTRTIIPGIEVPPVPRLPFTGTDTIVRVRPVDGGSVVTSEVSKVARDSQGRLYRERHHFGPLDGDPQKTLYVFYILDPIARTRTECMLATKQCTISRYYPNHAFSPPPAGTFDQGKQILVRESLGPQYTDGMNLTGTRETTTILPGTVGNDHALKLTREFWYSPELMTNISVTRNDPREGTLAIRLAILSRSEPEPAFFAVPVGYTITDLRAVSR